MMKNVFAVAETVADIADVAEVKEEISKFGEWVEGLIPRALDLIIEVAVAFYLYCDRDEADQMDTKNLKKISGKEQCGYRAGTVFGFPCKICPLYYSGIDHPAAFWRADNLYCSSHWFCRCGHRSCLTGQLVQFCRRGDHFTDQAI